MIPRAPRHTRGGLRPLVALWVALLPAPLAAGPAPVADTATASTGGRPPVDIRPVPDLVRAALSRPDDAGAWAGLAHALPELALAEDADPEAVLEASRLADSLSRAPIPPASRGASADVRPGEGPGLESTRGSGGALAGAPGVVPALRATASAWLGELSRASGALRLDPATAVTWGPWVLVVLLLGAGPLVRRRRARRAAAAATLPGEGVRRPRTPSRAQAGTDGASDPRSRTWTVTTLAENGLPPSEIARRTGMSQDAVQVLLGLRTAPSARAFRGGAGMGFDVPGFPDPTRPAASRPPSMTEQAAGVSAARDQLERGARRLSGGRLTYGPERRA